MADEPTKLRWKYTEEQKREALKLYAEHGPAEAGRQTGIPRATISQWAKRSGVTVTRAKNVREATKAAADKAAELREKLKLDCRNRAVDLVGRMAEVETLFVGKDGERVQVDRATAIACKDLAVAAGVLIDKAELLDGRATSRQETRNVDQMDSEIEKLLGQMAAHDGDPVPS